MSAQGPIRCAGCDYAGYFMSPDRQVLAWECDQCRAIPLEVRPQLRAELREIAARRTAKPPLSEALADLHGIVDGDDIDPAATLAELREPSGHLLAGVAELRAQVAALEVERDRLARVLACEVGDAEHASDGWQRDVHHRWSRRSPDFYLVAFKWGGTHTWEVWDNPDGTLICHGRAKYALDAMEAADEAARAGEAS